MWLQAGHLWLQNGCVRGSPGALSPTTLAALSFRCVAAEAQAKDT
jgi:hypothetical protein